MESGEEDCGPGAWSEAAKSPKRVNDAFATVHISLSLHSEATGLLDGR